MYRLVLVTDGDVQLVGINDRTCDKLFFFLFFFFNSV